MCRHGGPVKTLRPEGALTAVGLGCKSGHVPCSHPHPAAQVVDMLRQKARPYLFSNTLAPAVAGASLKVS